MTTPSPTIETRRYAGPLPTSAGSARWCAATTHRSVPAVGVVIERDAQGRARYSRPVCEACITATEARP